MQYSSKTPEDYLNDIPAERKEAFNKLRDTILKNIPKGFEEGMGSGMIGYSVPHSTYPAGYHCNPSDPVPFVGIASQKHFIAFYHMGIYADEKLLKWFQEEYPKHTKARLDMGKSCVRFTKIDQIPYDLIGELMQKITVEDWVKTYSAQDPRNKK